MQDNFRVSGELTSIAALNPFVRSVAPGRQQMFGSHTTQLVSHENLETPQFLEGVENAIGAADFSIRFPADGRVLDVILKYPGGIGDNAILSNPTTVVIFEHLDSLMLDCLIIPSYHLMHNDFGFTYKKKNTHLLVPGAVIRGDTIICTSPSVDNMGNLKMGIHLNVAKMSVVDTAEDGIVFSESAMTKMTTKLFGTRLLSFGKHEYPLNLHGGYGDFKFIPDIGECVKQDGLLCCFRKHNSITAPVDMTAKALQTPRYGYDQPVHVEPGAKIINVRAWNNPSHKSNLPIGMDKQLFKYADAASRYYKQLVDIFYKYTTGVNRLRQVSPELRALIQEAIADKGNGKDKVTKVYRLADPDEWIVEVVYEYSFVPDIASKFTGYHGNKGVAVKVRPDEHMPVDKRGRRADVIINGNSEVNRMIPSVSYEEYFSAVKLDMTERVRAIFGIQVPHVVDYNTAKNLVMDEVLVTKAITEEILPFYKILSPINSLLESKGMDSWKKHVLMYLTVKLPVMLLPVENPVDYKAAVEEIRNVMPPFRDKVTYFTEKGCYEETVTDVLISPMYILQLEKLGKWFTATASAKLNHFGLPGNATEGSKYSTPANEKAVKSAGETESRLYQSTLGEQIAADLLDQSNNPAHHREVCYSVLRNVTFNPAEMELDRERFPTGYGRPNSLYHDELNSAGVELVYDDKR